MFPYQKQRVAARKRLLNREDVTRFDEVPDFIVDAFFGSCTYKNRLLTAVFGYVNGLSVDQLLSLNHWNDMKEIEMEKIKKLYDSFEGPRYQQEYYSYNVHQKLVVFLNGDVRKFAVRLPKNWKIKNLDLQPNFQTFITRSHSVLGI